MRAIAVCVGLLAGVSAWAQTSFAPPSLTVEGSLQCSVTAEGYGLRTIQHTSTLTVRHNFPVQVRFFNFKDLMAQPGNPNEAPTVISVRLLLGQEPVFEGPIRSLNGFRMMLDPMRTGGVSKLTLERTLSLGPEFLPGSYRSQGHVGLLTN